MSGRDLTGDKLLGRDELLELLPLAWPGLEEALRRLERDDPLTIRAVYRLLNSAAVELRARDDEEKRRALLKLLGGSVVPVEKHEARVTELLAANGREVERGRRAREFVRWVGTMTGLEAESPDIGEELRDRARALLAGEPVSWRPKYGENERDRAAAEVAAFYGEAEGAHELVDRIAEELGLTRAR